MISSNESIKSILKLAKTIALVGYSDQPTRPSYQIGQFLREKGYVVYPVNPTISEIDGQRCYSSLSEIPKAIDLVNVFRRGEYLPEIVEECIKLKIKIIWLQLGIFNEQAQQKAIDAGIQVIVNRCIRTELMRS
uniref:CoA-binding domain protein n=2 Tax=Gloeothece TaxID=28070 RepID=E0UFH5_GLOV7|nr:CoA-binding domain protein [Gloeothece verrucosa PCC 7822]